MVKVKLLTSLAGHGFSHGHGEVIEVSEAIAERMIARGAAEAVVTGEEEKGGEDEGREGDATSPPKKKR